MTREVPHETKAAQETASDPRVSSWVTANAGSGKTHVLTQRVLRLLLQGVEPAQILCLTFTKAAAANMSSRVFGVLRQWTQLDDAALRTELAKTHAPADVSLDKARRLFARTIETPGGLKIQTIHAFCERILHQFPFEGNAPSQFRVVDALQQEKLLDESLLDSLSQAKPDPALTEAFAFLASECSGARLFDLLKEFTSKRRALFSLLRRLNGVDGVAKALSRSFGLGESEDAREMDRRVVMDGIPPSEWETLAKEFDLGTSNDLKQAAHLRRALAATGRDRADAYLGVFLTGEKTLKKNVATKNVDKFAANRLAAEKQRIEGLLEKLRAVRHVERTRALLGAAQAFLTAYERRKAQRDLLDFDDLIARTTALLAAPRSAWVLYKIDQGIEHILVDEAQDTSPEQWAILKALTEEFFAGEGRSQKGRTFFAVGDEKQSIYSFQGAAPHMFAAMKGHYAKQIRAEKFKPVELKLSFRSATGVLQGVDAVFAENFVGLSSDTAPPKHDAFKTDLPAHVEIWPVIEPSGESIETDWIPAPAADPQAGDPAVQLARLIAKEIAALTAPDSTARVHDGKAGALTPRRIRPGDVMILVRNRGPLFEAIIRALKDAQVPVAGADRMKLAEHIAVMDLIAAGRAALLPQDDLTLACVLKSPLIGFDEDDLFRVAAERGDGESLFDALIASPRDKDRDAARRVGAWRKLAFAVTPFRFYAHLLGPERGRHAIFARLGAEAGDAVNEFLRLALEHEAGATPSLARFLDSIESGEIEVKRDMEAEQDSVRVMTVHASKGLEAKVVFLPDTCGKAVAPQKESKIVELRDPDAQDGAAPFFVWAAKSEDQPAAVREARERRRIRDEQEHRRLLYVAMTRAEERLYVCGYKKAEDGCWHGAVMQALAPLAERVDVEDRAPLDHVLRIVSGEPRGEATPPAGTPPAPALPGWLMLAAPPEKAAPRISPSGAKTVAPARKAAGGDAAAYGSLVHELLEGLPEIAPEHRRERAAAYAGLRGGALSQARRSAAVEEALGVLAHPGLQDLFGAGSRAEVAIEARREGALVSGRMDRIAVTADRVIVADFKTGSGRDASIYAEQLGHYRRMLAALYPGRAIDCLIVFTQGPEIALLPALDAAGTVS